MPRRVGDFRGLTHLSRLRLLHAVQRLPGRRLPELASEAQLHPNTAREHLTVLENEGLVESRTLVTGARGRPPVAYHPVEDARRSEAALRRAEAAKARGEAYRRMVRAAEAEARAGSEAPAGSEARARAGAEVGEGTAAGVGPRSDDGMGAAREHGAEAAHGPVAEVRAGGETEGTGGASGLSAAEAAQHQLDALYEHLDDAGFEPALDEEALTLDLVPCRYFAVMDEDRRTVCAVHIRLIQQHLAQVPGPVELRRVQPFVTPESCVVTLGLTGEAGGADERGASGASEVPGAPEAPEASAEQGASEWPGAPEEPGTSDEAAEPGNPERDC